jgi:hypothetical protein
MNIPSFADPANLDDRFHETHPIGCHHSSLVSLACRSYILVIRSWSAYDSNHGSARLVVQPEPEFESENALGLLQAIYKSRVVPLSVRMKAAVKRSRSRARSSPQPQR